MGVGMRHAKPFSFEHPRLLDPLRARIDWTEMFGRDPFDCPHSIFAHTQRIRTITGHPPSKRYFCGDCKTSLGRHEKAINDSYITL